MKLILQLSFCRLLFNEVPSNLQLLSRTRFKTLRVMEDKVTSRVCNLMLNIMQASLFPLHVIEYIVHPNIIIQFTSSDGIKCISDCSSCFSARNSTVKGSIKSDWLAILVIYDGLCPLCYTTNLLKDGCLACISPPNDKDAKVWA